MSTSIPKSGYGSVPVSETPPADLRLEMRAIREGWLRNEQLTTALERMTAIATGQVDVPPRTQMHAAKLITNFLLNTEDVDCKQVETALKAKDRQLRRLEANIKREELQVRREEIAAGLERHRAQIVQINVQSDLRAGDLSYEDVRRRIEAKSGLPQRGSTDGDSV